jgi:hypothetical protein
LKTFTFPNVIVYIRPIRVHHAEHGPVKTRPAGQKRARPVEGPPVGLV